MIVLKRDGQGNSHAIFQIEMPDVTPLASEAHSVGIDMGLSTFATLSSGEAIDNPCWFRQSKGEFAVLQKRRARCTRGSHEYKQLSQRISLLHERTGNIRRDFHHKLSRQFVNSSA